ncbi:MAG: hypothetical protein Q9157_004384 [Trypethelium eluteriae]
MISMVGIGATTTCSAATTVTLTSTCPALATITSTTTLLSTLTQTVTATSVSTITVAAVQSTTSTTTSNSTLLAVATGGLRIPTGGLRPTNLARPSTFNFPSLSSTSTSAVVPQPSSTKSGSSFFGRLFM